MSLGKACGLKTPEECIEMALSCERMASVATTAESKTYLEQAAQQWRQLAEGYREIRAVKESLSKIPD
jgi:hypothetical protein